MGRIFNSFVSVAAVLALTPANAARVPETTPLIAENNEMGEVAAPKLSPVAEFWQFMQSEMAEELQELREPIDIEFRAALVPTGAAEADWNTKGIDLRGHIESLPGGIANNGLLTLGEVPSLEFFGEIPGEILTDWQFIQAGSKAVSPFEAKGGVFVAISPHHVVFQADDEIQTGNARCLKYPIERASDHVTVYRHSGIPFDPDSDASLKAEAEAIVMHYMFGGLSSPAICTIFQWHQDGHLMSLMYTPDGRPLGQMNDEKDQPQIVSTFDLYEQLSANYDSAFIDDERSSPAEAVRDPL